VPDDWIEGGDHIPPTRKYHLIVDTHYHGPETYEEALEEALERPAKYDWPAKDRYADERRPE
jgi:hypothetical protein